MATVLIVDDRAINREFLTTLLGYHGHRLLEAGDGAQALTLAAAERPDVVITDILMPTMDGYELVRQLRANPALADTAVIFYTAHYHGPEAANLAAQCGVQYVLAKPSEPEVILRTLQQALGNRDPPAAVEARGFDRAHLQLITDKLSENVDALRRNGERLQALIDVNLHLASERDPRRLLESVCHAARELIGAKYAVLMVESEDGTRTESLITSGMDSTMSAGLVPPASREGLVEAAIRTRKVCHARDVGAAGVVTGLPRLHPAVKSALFAPIISLSHSYGCLALTDKLGGDDFSEEDRHLLGILCAQLGRTYENGRLLKDFRASEQRYRTIFDNSVLGIFAIDGLERIVSANTALIRMLGYEGAESLPADADRVGRDLYVEPAEQARFRQRLVADNVVENFETRWRRQDGSAIWVSLSARSIGASDGSDFRHIVLVEDITEKLRLRDAVKEREEALFHAQRIAKLAHVISGPDGAFESWSETLAKLAGVEPERLPKTAREWLDLVHPEDRALFRERAIHAETWRTRTDLEYRLASAEGTPTHIWHTMEAFGAPDASGKSRWFNTLQDISDRKHAENRIKRLNRVHAVLSAINSAIVRLHDRQELFDEACRIAVVEGAFLVAWIAEVDPVTLEGRVVASSGADKGFLDLVNFGGDPGHPFRDRPGSTAVREMRPVVSNDLVTAPGLGSLRAELLARKHHAVAVFPLIVAGRVDAVMGLHTEERDFFDDEEVRLLNELASDVAFLLEYIAKEAKLDYLAYYDALTDLPNSGLFRDRLAQFLTRAEPERGIIAVYVINLDRFAHVNNTLGRHAGDVLLKLVAERFRKALPKASSLARIGADTFAVAIGDLQDGADGAALFLQNVILGALSPAFSIDGNELRVSARAGIALSPGDGNDADTLLKNAEAALKQVKISGKQYLFYASEMNASVAEKLALENELRVAMESGQFVLHYQPIVELSSGQIVGAEALIRWQHPELGLLPPGRFLAVIEDSDMSIPLGEWVMRTACAQVSAWHASGLHELSVSVNISARQFADESLVRRVAEALRQAGLEPRRLGLELTEDIVMQDAEKFIAKLHALKALGVTLSLDDFGTGYSSLSYLKRFPLDQLKVDQSFIREVTSNPDDAAIVEAVISIGNSMGLELVIEGVETAAQLGWLRRRRCAKIQGYYFSRPLPATEFEQILRDRKSLPSESAADAVEAKTLLIVDDEVNVVSAVARFLRREGYRILTAHSAAEAFEILALNAVHVILSDHRMPVMTGAEFLGRVKGLYPDTVRILFSGHVEIKALTDAVNRGAVYRFLLKPWDDDVLRESVRDAFHYYWITHSNESPSPVAVEPGGTQE